MQMTKNKKVKKSQNFSLEIKVKPQCNYKIIRKNHACLNMVRCWSIPGHGLIGLAGHQQVQLTPKKPSAGHLGGSSQPSEDKHIRNKLISFDP